MNREEKKKAIAAWLQVQLAVKGVSQGEVANAICVGNDAVSKWSRGVSKPLSENLLALYDHLSQLPSKNGHLVYPPVKTRMCEIESCPHLEECRERVLSEPPRPAMCLRLDINDLKVAEVRGELDEWLWWMDGVPDYESVDELLGLVPELPLGEC